MDGAAGRREEKLHGFWENDPLTAGRAMEELGSTRPDLSRLELSVNGKNSKSSTPWKVGSCLRCFLRTRVSDKDIWAEAK